MHAPTRFSAAARRAAGRYGSKSPSPAAVRRRAGWRLAKAAVRERARRGERCGRFRYDATVLDFLVRNRWLAEGDAGNAKAVGDAVSRLLAASARL
jgi:hypothetical protein